LAGNTIQAAAKVMTEVLGQPSRDRPTAVFTVTDVLALGVLTAARAAGILVPGELSVVGFDDIPEAAASSPPLTTVAQPLFRLGQEAARIALLQIAGQRGRPRGLATELVLRGSTGPPP
jgi:DNA-binding LacI/PurR family transcriptional regulator